MDVTTSNSSLMFLAQVVNVSRSQQNGSVFLTMKLHWQLRVNTRCKIRSNEK